MLFVSKRFLSGIVMLVTCNSSGDVTENYRVFEEALRNASVEVNKLKVPQLMYGLDASTARKYFERYFSHNLMTNALRVNLGYPVFSWGNNHRNLQMGLTPVLIAQIEYFFEKNSSPTDISETLITNEELHDHIFYLLRFLVNIARSKDISSTYRQEVGRKLLMILERSHLNEECYAEIDKEKYPFVNSLKTQLLLTCFSFAIQVYDVSSLSKKLALTDLRRQLFDTYNVLVLDNQGFDSKQLMAIKSYIANTPHHLQFPIVILCYDFLISSKNKRINVHSFYSCSNINVFGMKVGKGVNSFPEDYKKTVKSDHFTIVLAHEYAHGVDSRYVKSMENLTSFKKALLEKAGTNHANYLRSMFEDDFFQKNPVEFIASMAHQYFSSSKDMFDYALQKAENGNLNQINQFVLMASIWSEANKAFFYRIDSTGNIEVQIIPIEKEHGLITSLSLGTKKYRFHYSGGVIDSISGM